MLRHVLERRYNMKRMMKRFELNHAFRMFLFMALVLSTVFSAAMKPIRAEAEITITEQPQSVEVEYPDGATFHVAVDHPENVASYSWEVCDMDAQSEKWTPLEGSGQTDTYIRPSTGFYNHDHYYRCVITDKSGNRVYSERATLIITNRDERIPVLYVGDYAVRPGETLDVATTGYGTGRVSLDEDGVNMSIINVKMCASEPISSSFVSESLGLYFMGVEQDKIEYNVRFTGENVITGNFFEEETNSSGVTVGFYMERDGMGNHPTVNLSGTGSLLIDGGEQIHTNGNLVIDMDLTLDCHNDNYNDGIYADNLIIEEGRTVSVKCNGSGVHVDSDLRMMKNSTLNIEAYAPHVSVGATVKQGIFASGSIYMDHATVNITGGAKAVNFIPYNSMVGMFAGINLANGGSLNMDASTVNIELGVEEVDGDPYVMNLYGVSGSDITSHLSMDNGSSLSYKSNAKSALSSCAIGVGGKVILNGYSKITVDNATFGEAAGIETDLGLYLTNSSIDSKVESLGGQKTYGIMCGDAEISISDESCSIHSIAKNGYAIGVSTGDTTEEEIGYVKDYTPAVLLLKEQAAITTPKKGVISTFGIPGYGALVVTETVFDPSNTAAPAEEITIGVAQTSEKLLMYVAAAAALCVFGYAFMKFRKRQKA